MMKKCNHRYSDGSTALKVLPKFKVLGVLKPRKIAICELCKENIELSEEEYKELRGDSK